MQARSFLPLLAPLLLAQGLLACGDKDGDDSGASTLPPGSTTLLFTDANNYDYDATLVVDTIAVQAGADVEVCWDQLTQDLRGRPVVPTEIDLMRLIAFSVTKEEVLASINDNSLSQSDIRDFRELDQDGTISCANLSAFAIFGNEFAPETDFVVREGTWTWAITLWDEADGRLDILASIFLEPTPESDVTTVDITDSTGSLDFLVDLHSADPLFAVADTPDTTFDWSGATTEASGQDFDPALGDRLLIGHVAGATVDSVEADFMTILESADALYRMDVAGLTSADLSQAVERDSGAAFPGFDSDGVWLLGVECTTCTSPTPVLLSVVEIGS